MAVDDIYHVQTQNIQAQDGKSCGGFAQVAIELLTQRREGRQDLANINEELEERYSTTSTREQIQTTTLNRWKRMVLLDRAKLNTLTEEERETITLGNYEYDFPMICTCTRTKTTTTYRDAQQFLTSDQWACGDQIETMLVKLRQNRSREHPNANIHITTHPYHRYNNNWGAGGAPGDYLVRAMIQELKNGIDIGRRMYTQIVNVNNTHWIAYAIKVVQKRVQIDNGTLILDDGSEEIRIDEVKGSDRNDENEEQYIILPTDDAIPAEHLSGDSQLHGPEISRMAVLRNDQMSQEEIEVRQQCNKDRKRRIQQEKGQVRSSKPAYVRQRESKRRRTQEKGHKENRNKNKRKNWNR